MPYLRAILLRERIEILHAHASLSSMAHEGIFHSWHLGIRTVFTDHSLFALDDAVGILTNKLLEAALRNVDATICVSYTGRENTVLRASLVPSSVYVIPNALIPEQFKPAEKPVPTKPLNIVVVSRLAYRKGVDLLVATAPRICERFPDVHFIIGGDGPKLGELLQMREKFMLQDRMTLLGAVRHEDVRDVLVQGSIFLNTSLTEAFGVAILEAACAGLYVVCTRVGGVPEVLLPDLISFAEPDEDGAYTPSPLMRLTPTARVLLLTRYFVQPASKDVFQALSEAINFVQGGNHDPHAAHARVKGMYAWNRVAARTEKVYETIVTMPEWSLWERIQRFYSLGTFAGPIFVIILVVQCYFWWFIEWLVPLEDIDYVEDDWDIARFSQAVSDTS
ncbi:glycosyltransferase family 4 protein [Clavulina sp. PMI_390]|nr:glycosyltransferase family 4 protein [Clavulina sp. PMI_390]